MIDRKRLLILLARMVVGLVPVLVARAAEPAVPPVQQGQQKFVGGNDLTQAQKPAVRLIEGVAVPGGIDRQGSDITTEKELAKFFNDKTRAEILKQVDFAKEKLVWVTWCDSSSSGLTWKVQEDQAKITVLLTIVKSNPALADLRMHGVLVVMPKQASWQLGSVTDLLPGQENLAMARYLTKEGKLKARFEMQPTVRLVKGVTVAAGKGQQGCEITTEKELAKLFHETARAEILKQVDFAKEKLVYVTWCDSGSSYLSWDVQEDQGKITVFLAVVLPMPATADLRMHGVLVVMPKLASWRFAGGAGNLQPELKQPSIQAHADGQQHVGEALHVGGLNGEGVVGGHDRLVEVPFFDGFQVQVGS
jgi:hypothetical protein